MENAKQFLKDNKILSRISFKSEPKHTVKLLNDRLETINVNGSQKTGVKFLVEENGEQKTFFTGSHSLIQKLAEFNVGDTVVIEMKSVNSNGNFISVFEVSRAQGANTQPVQSSPATEPVTEQAAEEEIGGDENEINIDDIPF